MRNLRDLARLIANYGPGEWVKKQFVHYVYNAQGARVGNYTVHYFENLSTGQRVEFKFTNRP